MLPSLSHLAGRNAARLTVATRIFVFLLQTSPFLPQRHSGEFALRASDATTMVD